MFSPLSFDLQALDQVIESYDYADDPVLAEHFRPIEDVLWGMIENYGAGINEYGQQLAAHLRRTSLDGMEFMTARLGFSEKAARNFHAANLLQDLGKIHGSYDPQIWSLPHSPTEQERAEKRLHPQRGADILAAALHQAPRALLDHPHVKIVAPAIMLFHHERADGKGPFGIKGEAQGRLIRMTAIVDTKDGDMNHRPHQSFRRSEEETLWRMKGLAGYDDKGKYAGAFDDMLDLYMEHRGVDATPGSGSPARKMLAGKQRLG